MKVFEGKNVPIKAWVDGVAFEDEAKEQLLKLSELPFLHKHIAVMPDVHGGNGSTIGSVIVTNGAIIPAAVGVDVGCGMIAVRTTLKAADLPDNLSRLRHEIEKRTPHGRTDNGGANDRGAWATVPKKVETEFLKLKPRLDLIVEKHPKIERAAKRAANHAQTLGTGNHFIELCLDENQNVWVMLHSGSRGIGNRIGQHFIDLAKADMRKWFINLPDSNLAYIPVDSTHFNDYCEAIRWAQEYAALNRRLMLDATLEALYSVIPVPFECDCESIQCHHNYVSWERHFGGDVIVTRKGAVAAFEGQLGIIPGSMGAKSFIVRGKGNRESFCSCSHGAGRIMSRTEAKKRFTLDDHVAATEGVECRKDVDVLDETPAAYKNIDDVMAAQSDLVEVVHTLKQILCVKG